MFGLFLLNEIWSLFTIYDNNWALTMPLHHGMPKHFTIYHFILPCKYSYSFIWGCKIAWVRVTPNSASASSPRQCPGCWRPVVWSGSVVSCWAGGIFLPLDLWHPFLHPPLHRPQPSLCTYFPRSHLNVRNHQCIKDIVSQPGQRSVETSVFCATEWIFFLMIEW